MRARSEKSQESEKRETRRAPGLVGRKKSLVCVLGLNAEGMPGRIIGKARRAYHPPRPRFDTSSLDTTPPDEQSMKHRSKGRAMADPHYHTLIPSH